MLEHNGKRWPRLRRGFYPLKLKANCPFQAQKGNQIIYDGLEAIQPGYR
jgi:hypothetical protein